MTVLTTGTVGAGVMLVLVGMAAAVIGTAVVGMVGVAAGIMVVTVAAGQLAPRSVSVSALAYSEERSQPLLTTVAMITRHMPGHPHPPFGIGAMPIRATTLRYPNAPFRGDRLFSNQVGKLARLRRPEAAIRPSG